MDVQGAIEIISSSTVSGTVSTQDSNIKTTGKINVQN